MDVIMKTIIMERIAGTWTADAAVWKERGCQKTALESSERWGKNSKPAAALLYFPLNQEDGGYMDVIWQLERSYVNVIWQLERGYMEKFKPLTL
jgi:hypothetical protein